ncbi:Panacea domain-containing protein [Spiroplasma alleghenense]|uniref:Antitoxin SocA-like Panacea domain-containing protein n=1 Tax=Spiroplasma alleghenense TaxID=216931 RepID=A0A345Z586_9MOLU|nr:type II toxin-antitoxin system antitoxin SocA domain-containing protein [Spiroplasma alleghenense]AXK51765.1 hypothetical protein SALLE_v1c10950 [Spiroplasma alleghenense]
MSKYDVKNIANYVINYFYENSDKLKNNEENFEILEINNLKMQKVLYFLYGFFYSETREELFDVEFLAWKLGPVIKSIYEINKNATENNGYRNIPKDTYCEFAKKIEDEDKKLINQILDNLMEISTWALVELSHKPGGPWEATKQSEVISRDLLNKYFRNLELK